MSHCQAIRGNQFLLLPMNGMTDLRLTEFVRLDFNDLRNRRTSFTRPIRCRQNASTGTNQDSSPVSVSHGELSVRRRLGPIQPRGQQQGERRRNDDLFAESMLGRTEGQRIIPWDR